MQVRLAGVPAAYTVAAGLLVVDANENHYLVARDEPAVTRLNRGEAMLIMSFYEPVQSMRWHSIEAVAKALRDADGSARPNVPVLATLESICRLAG